MRPPNSLRSRTFPSLRRLLKGVVATDKERANVTELEFDATCRKLIIGFDITADGAVR